MKGPNGNLLTNKEELKEATLNHYKHVLRDRNICEGLENHKLDIEKLCAVRLENTKQNKTPDWTKSELLLVLKGLKNKKI